VPVQNIGAALHAPLVYAKLLVGPGAAPPPGGVVGAVHDPPAGAYARAITQRELRERGRQVLRGVGGQEFLQLRRR
jgi:hypothetical protein